MSFARPIAVAAICLIFAASTTARAQIWTAGGGANALWSNPMNWDTNTVPTNNGTAIVNFTGASNGGQFNSSIDHNWNISQLNFTGGQYIINRGNNAALTLGSLSNQTPHEMRIDVPIYFNTPTPTISNQYVIDLTQGVNLGSSTLTMNSSYYATNVFAGITGAGVQMSSDGALYISGQEILSPSSLIVGNTSYGNLSILSGTLTAPQSVIGETTSASTNFANSYVDMSGNTTAWNTTAGQLYVGYGGNGQLQASSGAKLTSVGGTIAALPGTNSNVWYGFFCLGWLFGALTGC